MCALVVITSHRATIVLRARTAQVGAARVDPPDHSGQGEHCKRKADPRYGDVRVSRICCGSVPPEVLAWSGGPPHIRTHVADDALNEIYARYAVRARGVADRVSRGRWGEGKGIQDRCARQCERNGTQNTAPCGAPCRPPYR
eukprot:scaffold22727_cov58-Phaeocystis_antarctica.AAC.5